MSAEVIDIYGGRDPRDIPNYTLPEVARLAGVPKGTLKYWVKTRPVILKPDPESSLLSFNNVLEAYVLGLLRREHGIPLRKIRPAIKHFQEEYGIAHPLLEQDFETNGTYLFTRHGGEIINASRRGQIAIPDFVEIYLERVEWDKEGGGRRYFPLLRSRFNAEVAPQEPKVVMVDPRVSFGKPILREIGVPTAVILSRWKGGDTIKELAEDYGRSESEIEDALYYESLAA
ncbi:MAG: DUF433 domain-containing protein [Armatimonadetes bacterium]|nr:DUF433 domain-containing protein [Armatimonadota bacterium]